MTSTPSKNWLNIVSKHRVAVLIGLVLLFVAMFTVVITPKTHADTLAAGASKSVADCKEILPKKVVAVCDGEYVTKARNVAAHHCKETQSESCVTDKAAAYFKKALAKDTTPSSVSAFEKNLNKVFADAGGDPNNPPDWAKEGLDGQCESGDAVCNSTVESTVDPAACTAAANANKPLPQGCPSDANQSCTKNSCDLVKKYVNPALEVVTAIFGLVAIASLIIGGIQYSASAGDPQKVTEAKKRISNTLLAIVAYLLLFAFLQFLIPGGLFKT